MEKFIKKNKEIILFGSDTEEIKFNFDDGMKNTPRKKPLRV